MTRSPSTLIRARARECLLGNYGKAVSALLTEFLIEMFIYLLCTPLFAIKGVPGHILYVALNLLYFLISFILSCGYSFFVLKLCAGQAVTVSDIFQGFRMKAGTCTALFLILVLMVSLCFSPMALFAVLFSSHFRHSTVMLILSVLLCIGIVISSVIILNFSQITFLLWDYPGYGFKRIIKASRRIMKGNRLRLFYLCAGFIPLYLLCLLTFGLGFLWFIPYYRTTMAQFYLDVVKETSTRPVSINHPATPSYPAFPG